jgi:hypothetical protein
MRDKRTGAAAAQDPDSPINRALAAWDCDVPEGLKPEHVSEGIRAVKITKSKVGSEARKAPARKNPAKPRASKPKANPRDAMLYVVHVADSQGKPAYDIAKFRKRADALQYAKAYASAHGVRVVLTSRAL